MTNRLSPVEKQALDHYVHTPAEVSSGFIRYSEEIKQFSGITFGCRALDTHIIPLRPGRVMSIIARSGHGKTSVGGALVFREAQRIKRAGLEDKLYAAHVSWEQPVEELDVMYQPHAGFTASDVAWGRVGLAQIIAATPARQALPVWTFGDSIYRTQMDTPPLTLDRLFLAIAAIKKQYGRSPSMLFVDYIQDIPVEKESERYMQVSQAMRLTKRLAVQLACPIILGVQANQRVDDREDQSPDLRDAEWSAVIGQKSDVAISLWRPIKSHSPLEAPWITVGQNQYPNEERLLVVKLLKQRFEKGSGKWAVSFDPATLELSDYPITNYPKEVE